MHHTTSEPTPATKGITIHWAHQYDLAVRLLTLGKDRTLRQKTLNLAHVQPGETVLDVGCGTGDLTLLVKSATGPDGTVHGIDAAPEMVAVARQKAAQSGLAVDFQVGLIEKLAFPDSTFDLVLSSLMMHHLPEETKRQGLVEILRVLKPGGRLLVIDFKRPTSRMERLVQPLFFHHGMLIGVQDLPPLMETAGFEGVETGDVGFLMLGFVRAYKS